MSGWMTAQCHLLNEKYSVERRPKAHTTGFYLDTSSRTGTFQL